MSDKISTPITKWSGYQFSGVIWNIVAHNRLPVLIIETRSEAEKTARFSAYDIARDSFLWKDFELEEKWWISVTAFAGNVILFTVYLDTQNPDKKSVVAFDCQSMKMLWWKNNFTISSASEYGVKGVDSQAGMKFLLLNLQSGEPLKSSDELADEENFLLRRPLQYLQDTPYFLTVAEFLRKKLDATPINIIEYLESDGFVAISYYSGTASLANYLIVLDNAGAICLSEKIGERLKGIGLDTFFVFAGYLIFVQNKRELVSYKLV